MKTGMYHTGKVVHYAREVKRSKYTSTMLYESLCSKMQAYRTLCYLDITDLPVTCKRCLKKYEQVKRRK